MFSHINNKLMHRYEAIPVILLIMMIMIALKIYAIPSWKFKQDIRVNSQHSMGEFIARTDIFLNVEFKLVSNDSSFTIQVVEHLINQEHSVDYGYGLYRFDFLFNKTELLNQMESVKITLKYEKGITNVYPLSYEFRMGINEKWHRIFDEKKEQSLTQTSYEISTLTFLEQENSFILGIFCDMLPEIVNLKSPIQVAGPRFIKVENTQQGKLRISLQDQPLQKEPGTIKLYQDNVTEIARKLLPNNLDPKVSFSFEMKNVILSQIVMVFESDSELNNPEGIPIICSCSDLKGNYFTLLKTGGSRMNSKIYTCRGDASQCSRITLSSAIPIKLAPGEKIRPLESNFRNDPYIFVQFTDILPKTTYSLDFIGNAFQVTITELGTFGINRYQFSGSFTKDVILENLDRYFIKIDARGSYWMIISLSQAIQTLPLHEYQDMVNNAQLLNTQVIAVSSGLGIAVVLNWILVFIVCILGFIVFKNRGLMKNHGEHELIN